MEPAVDAWQYTCPYCDTLTGQHHRKVLIDQVSDPPKVDESAKRTRCNACNIVSWWVNGVLVYPPVAKTAEPPIEGMPEDVLDLYNEARMVADLSPRSASALLRTALEVLTTNHLGQDGVRLNDAIGNLVQAGRLDDELQQAMDVLRLTGNGAVHPREVRLDDNSNDATAMFELLNLVVDRLVVRPARIRKLYADLPESKREQIDKRDGG
ncbi:hypothetical protein A5792_04275 [Mycolicibacterium peregrinum]|uniref:DUF4145 domain-containing protein n=2 Tax=Mycolicibacterium peregrinum TaxID=43304 RepID=A0A1A0QXR5_MYCPR|nr:hypothetical protein A5792_04275 [Mycolicibacterium peregrinum]